MDDDRVIDRREAGDKTLFLYVEFDEYDPGVRRELTAESGAFEANTIYEKELSD